MVLKIEFLDYKELESVKLENIILRKIIGSLHNNNKCNSIVIKK